MADRKYVIHEHVVPGKRLGRSVHHDLRSLQYQVRAAGTPVTVRWQRVIPILDQGDLGSCTGNATTGVLGSEPFYDTLQNLPGIPVLDEDFAVRVYSLATTLDEFDGTYKPDDTGSTGLAAAKAAKSLGLISGYLHITSLAAAHTAIQSGPFVTGTNWLSGMDEPDASGRVSATGTVRGGHEYEVIGYDATHGLWEFVNSWGDGWGKAGHFFLTDADYASLLAADGDATQFVPIIEPAPTPTPPTPTPASNAFPLSAVQPWLNSHLYTVKGCAAQAAIKKWLAGGGK